MKKLFRPGDLLLLGLGGLLDIFEDLRDPFGLMSTGCKQLYGWVPEKYKRHNFAALVRRRLKTGEIEKIVKKENVYLRLTSAGKEKIIREFPFLAIQKKRWDKRWRVVLYDVAETSRYKRDLLRNKLEELCFGLMQRSVWITPFDFAKDFKEFVEAKGLGENVYILESPAFLSDNPKKLAAKVWGLEKLNERYKKLYEKAQDLFRLLSSNSKKKTSEKNHITHHDRGEKVKTDGERDGRIKEKEGLAKKARKIKSQYLTEFISDPHLPKELLSDDWYGKRVRGEIDKIDKLLKKMG